MPDLVEAKETTRRQTELTRELDKLSAIATSSDQGGEVGPSMVRKLLRTIVMRADGHPGVSGSNVSDAEVVPAGVRELVRHCIDRVETLHVLFLLQSTAPRKWTVRDVSLERCSSRYAAEMSLRMLANRCLLLREADTYRFAPRTDELADKARGLAECYRTRPAAVIALIFSS